MNGVSFCNDVVKRYGGMKRGLRLVLLSGAALAALGVVAACGNFDAKSEDSADGAASSADGLEDARSTGNDGAADGGAVSVPDGGGLSLSSSCPPPGNEGPGCDDGGGITWNGRCYFAVGPLQSEVNAETACAARNAHLATFTCAEEWQGARAIGGANYWLGAAYVASKWTWTTNEPFTFWPPGSFDAGPQATAACLVRDKNAAWIPTDCTSSSSDAFCERGP